MNRVLARLSALASATAVLTCAGVLLAAPASAADHVTGITASCVDGAARLVVDLSGFPGQPANRVTATDNATVLVDIPFGGGFRRVWTLPGEVRHTFSVFVTSADDLDGSRGFTQHREEYLDPCPPGGATGAPGVPVGAGAGAPAGTGPGGPGPAGPAPAAPGPSGSGPVEPPPPGPPPAGAVPEVYTDPYADRTLPAPRTGPGSLLASGSATGVPVDGAVLLVLAGIGTVVLLAFAVPRTARRLADSSLLAGWRRRPSRNALRA